MQKKKKKQCEGNLEQASAAVRGCAQSVLLKGERKRQGLREDTVILKQIYTYNVTRMVRFAGA